MLLLLVPILGNICIAILDIDCALKAEKYVGLANGLKGDRDAGTRVKLYRSAAYLQSDEGRFKLGVCYITGEGLREDLPPDVFKKEFYWIGVRMLRHAASHGHKEAQQLLGQLK